MFSDRSLKSGSYEVQAAYQPMRTRFEDGVLSVTNRYDFTDFSKLRLEYTIEADGVVIEEKTAELTLAPHETARLPVTVPAQTCRYGMYLTCRLYDGDTVIARTQHKLKDGAYAPAMNGAASMQEQNGEIIFSGTGFRYVFSKRLGTFTSLCVDGAEQLAAPAGLTVWRAPTDNDRNIRLLWHCMPAIRCRA